MVAVAGTPTEPEVLDRRRIELAERTTAGPVQPYHTVRELGIEKAQKYLDRQRIVARGCAVGELRRVMESIGGRKAVGCGMLVSSGRIPGTLEATLRSHPAIHTAEGEFFRDALVQAAGMCGLPVRRVKEKELFDAVGVQFGMASLELEARMNGLGKVLGPPWRQDEKYAALVGWLAATR